MTRTNLVLLLILIPLGISGYLMSCATSKGIISTYYPNHTLVQFKDLNEDVREYFAEKYPNSHPGCIKGDFDGDGLIDYALLLRTNIKGRIIEKLVVLKGENGKKFILIDLDESDKRVGDSFLRHIPAGRVEKCDRTETVTIDRPGFEIVLFEAASRVYFWKEGKFSFIQTSD
jgi:hypothetical protein